MQIASMDRATRLALGVLVLGTVVALFWWALTRNPAPTADAYVGTRLLLVGLLVVALVVVVVAVREPPS